jgi:hypothetical protein
MNNSIQNQKLKEVMNSPAGQEFYAKCEAEANLEAIADVKK